MFALYSFKKLEFFEQVGKIHYFRAGSIKRAGRNFEQNSIIEQVLIRASRLENDQNFLVRACSLNRHTRVLMCNKESADCNGIVVTARLLLMRSSTSIGKRRIVPFLWREESLMQPKFFVFTIFMCSNWVNKRPLTSFSLFLITPIRIIIFWAFFYIKVEWSKS